MEKLCDDFEGIIRASVKGSELTEHGVEVPGFMFLSIDDLNSANYCFEAYIKLVTSLGFEVRDLGEFTKGSWIRKGIGLFTAAKNSDELQAIYDKGQKAIELATIEKLQSEVNKNNAEAAAAFINSVKDIPEAATRIGSLIIVKAIINGTTKIASTVLSTEQLIKLEKNPLLLTQPGEILMLINREQ